MAFNIMDLFGSGALNRLLQPAQTQGVQNFLANPGVAQQGFDPSRMGGGDRLPAVGMDGLRERLGADPMQAMAGSQVSSGAGQGAQAQAGFDPWQGLREADVQRPDPMQTASTQQAPAQSPAFGMGIDKAALNDIFTGWAMGSTPSESIAKGAQMVAANRGTRKNVNDTVEWLKKKGMDEQQARMLAGSPPALNEYLKTMAAGNDPMKQLQLEKTQLEVQNLKNPNAKLSETEKAYNQAVQDGFTGTRMDYEIKMKEAGRNKIDINTGVKLPSGYEWLDPNDQSKGVKPIAGGPATQLPGELAARIGLADSWLQNDLPGIKSSVNAGDVTGIVDRYQAANNQSSPQASTYRKIQSGVEVLSRLLSGAGMTQVEIDEKAARYQPTYTDDTTSLADKIDQLAQEIKATRDSAMQGRGGPIAGQQPQQGGVVDYQEYFKGP